MISGLLLFAIILGLAVVTAQLRIIKAFLLSLVAVRGVWNWKWFGVVGLFFFHFIYFLLCFLKFACFVMVSFCSFLCWAQMDWRGGGSHIKKVLLISLWSLFLSISVFFFNAPFVSRVGCLKMM